MGVDRTDGVQAVRDGVERTVRVTLGKRPA
jgi:hypothetical protein